MILLFNLRFDWASLEIVCPHILRLIKEFIILSISLSFKDILRRFEVRSELEAHLRLGMLIADRNRLFNWSLDLSSYPL